MRRVVYVVGPTGSGKSRLGIDIACACNGEVISADAIQMYRGLDVASAKVPLAERRGIAHHLMSFLPPRSVMTVREFRGLAGAVIDDVAARGKLPVVVGGTGYYVQSLLRESLLEEDEAEARELGASASASASAGADGGAEGENPAAQHARLCRVDPVMGQRLHPNDTRRVARALKVFDDTGVPMSTVLARQAARLAGAGAAAAPSAAGAPPQADPRVYWLTVDDRRVHDARLDARVDSMLEQGLVAEVQALRACLAAEAGGAEPAAGAAAPSARTPAAAALDQPSPLTLRVLDEYKAASGRTFLPPLPATGAAAAAPLPDGSYSGLLQAIGYKEFSEYLECCEAAAAGGGGEGAAAALQAAALCRGVERLRTVTHAYARKQDRWIRNRFEKRGVPLVRVDTAGLEGGGGGPWWQQHVQGRIVADVAAWLAGGAGAPALLPPTCGASPAPHPSAAASSSSSSSSSSNDLAQILDWGGQRVCETCGGKLLNGRLAWEEHARSRMHKKRSRGTGAERWQEASKRPAGAPAKEE